MWVYNFPVFDLYALFDTFTYARTNRWIYQFLCCRRLKEKVAPLTALGITSMIRRSKAQTLVSAWHSFCDSSSIWPHCFLRFIDFDCPTDSPDSCPGLPGVDPVSVIVDVVQMRSAISQFYVLWLRCPDTLCDLRYRSTTTWTILVMIALANFQQVRSNECITFGRS